MQSYSGQRVWIAMRGVWIVLYAHAHLSRLLQGRTLIPPPKTRSQILNMPRVWIIRLPPASPRTVKFGHSDCRFSFDRRHCSNIYFVPLRRPGSAKGARYPYAHRTSCGEGDSYMLRWLLLNRVIRRLSNRRSKPRYSPADIKPLPLPLLNGLAYRLPR